MVSYKQFENGVQYIIFALKQIMHQHQPGVHIIFAIKQIEMTLQEAIEAVYTLIIFALTQME